MNLLIVIKISMFIKRNGDNEPSQAPAGPLTDSLYKQVINLLQLVKTSSSRMSEAAALFMDELANVVGKGHLDSKVEVTGNWRFSNCQITFVHCSNKWKMRILMHYFYLNENLDIHVLILDSYHLICIWSSWWNFDSETAWHFISLLPFTPPPHPLKKKVDTINWAERQKQSFKSNLVKCSHDFLILGQIGLSVMYYIQVNRNRSWWMLFFCFRSGSRRMWRQISRTIMWWTWRRQPPTGNWPLLKITENAIWWCQEGNIYSFYF